VALVLGLDIFFLQLHLSEQVYLFSRFFIASHSSTWSAIKKTTSPEEARNPTTPALDQDPAMMMMRVRASRDLLIKPHVGTWDTVTPSDAQEND
jgi:hypothetical protein